MSIGIKTRLAYRKIRNEAKELTFPYARYEKRNNIIFIHVPKVAGTSIVWAISRTAGGRKHLPWYVYKTANPMFFEAAFKFAFVRNPWDRVASAYRYLYRGGNGSSDLSLSWEIAQYNGFSDFIVSGLGRGLYRNHLLFLPQSEFVVNGEGKVVVDFLGRYETLYDDCQALFERLGIKHNQLEKKNGGENKGNYKDLYKGDGDIEIVGELYKQDANVFGYSF